MNDTDLLLFDLLRDCRPLSLRCLFIMHWQQALMEGSKQNDASTPVLDNRKRARVPTTMWFRATAPATSAAREPSGSTQSPLTLASFNSTRCTVTVNKTSKLTRETNCDCTPALLRPLSSQQIDNAVEDTDPSANDDDNSLLQFVDDSDASAGYEDDAGYEHQNDAGYEQQNNAGNAQQHGLIARRLWDKRALFPAGADKWDNAANCQAALRYDCPCGRRCLSKVADVIALYDHRKQLRAHIGKNIKSGKLRDVLRDRLKEHYDADLGAFSQSFVVSGVGGVCERAYAVAAGVSEATFVRARADVTKNRPYHAERQKVKVERVSEARRQLDAWVRAQRNTMEGNKTSGLKWYTERVTEKQLWNRYVNTCDRAQVNCSSGPLLRMRC